jgi:putative ABC transport system permease protein
VDPGFIPTGRIAIRFPSKPVGYESSHALWDFEQRVRQQLDGAPAITGITATSSLPLERGVNTPMTITGHPDISGSIEWRAVSPDYFRTLGISLRAGRVFEASDGEGNLPVALVNEAFAQKYFPGQSPIGQRIETGRFQGELLDSSVVAPAAEIVGIVGDIREVSLRAEPRRTMYVPQAQASNHLANVMGTMPVFIATSRSTGGAVDRALVEAFHAVDPSLPRPEIFPLDDVVARSLARERFGATLLGMLAALALALTAFGIYGVLAYTIQQRRREIGIRMALGAGGQQVMRLVMGQGIAPVLLGVLLGLAGALALSRLVVSFLWGVKPGDPVTLASVAALLLGVAVLASWIPAREAARLDPLRTLNSE